MRTTAFLLVFCNALLQAYSVFYSSKPAPVMKARIGENVTFSWNFTLESGDELILLKLEYSKTRSFETSSVRIAYRTKDSLFIVDKPFKDHVLVQPSGALTLLNVSARDRGFYKYHIDLNSGYLQHKVELYVGVPPLIHLFPSPNVELLEGDYCKLSCEVTGYPSPNIFWYWNRISMAKVKLIELKSLEITNAELSHSGNYKCFASNYMGDTNRTLRLQVYKRLRVRSFFNTASLDGTIYQCEEVKFTCEAVGNKPPVSSYNFYHNNRLVVRGSKTGKFRIPEVQKKHEGRYSCVPKNRHGLGFNKSLDLIVFDAPENCKKTSATPTDESTDVKTTLLFTEWSLTPSDKIGDVMERHSGSQGKRASCLVTALLWSIYLICNRFL